MLSQAEPPDGLLLPLRRQQLQSLAWMQACERLDRPPLLLGCVRHFVPELRPHGLQPLASLLGRCVARVQRSWQLQGGLLADAVGSGKTAVTLALVASDQPPARTLVLMPGRLIKQWRTEVEKFLEPSVVELELWEGQELPLPGQSSNLSHVETICIHDISARVLYIGF